MPETRSRYSKEEGDFTVPENFKLSELWSQVSRQLLRRKEELLPLRPISDKLRAYQVVRRSYNCGTGLNNFRLRRRRRGGRERERGEGGEAGSGISSDSVVFACGHA
jgi:hypothetical protein